MKNPFSNSANGPENLSFSDSRSLYQAYMPFIKGGGLFVPSRSHQHKIGDEVFITLRLPKEEKVGLKGRVCWISPSSMQNGKPPGYGVQIVDDETGIKDRIESQIANLMAAKAPTLTV